MSAETNQSFGPGPRPNTVRTKDGSVLDVPEGWALVRPGDQALTLRVKRSGPHWAVSVTRGRKVFSKGVWAPGEIIEQIIKQLERERAAPEFAKRQEYNALRRDREQTRYVDEFFNAVVTYLRFPPDYSHFAERLARAVTDITTPIGAGTVGRTELITIEKRADAAVIAWMRHHCTEYETMSIPKNITKRREIRRRLAKLCVKLLNDYRSGKPVAPNCPLAKALSKLP